VIFLLITDVFTHSKLFICINADVEVKNYRYLYIKTRRTLFQAHARMSSKSLPR